jgi:hypothetical protein
MLVNVLIIENSHLDLSYSFINSIFYILFKKKKKKKFNFLTNHFSYLLFVENHGNMDFFLNHSRISFIDEKKLAHNVQLLQYH